MKELTLFLRKYLFAIALMLVGLLVVLLVLFTGQNVYILYAGFMIMLLGLFGFLVANEVLKGSILTIAVFVFFAIAALTGFFVYRSIQEPLEFAADKKERHEAIKNNLMAIKDLQLSYKSVKGNYSKNFDDLLGFVENDSFPVVKAIGNVPDSLTEAQALEQGLISRDTVKVSIKDSMAHKLSRDYNITDFGNLAMVPFTKGEKFRMDAGEIERGKVKVPVFEVSVKNEVIFPDWDEHFYQDEEDLQIGSMAEPITTGNWQ